MKRTFPKWDGVAEHLIAFASTRVAVNINKRQSTGRVLWQNASRLLCMMHNQFKSARSIAHTRLCEDVEGTSVSLVPPLPSFRIREAPLAILPVYAGMAGMLVMV